MAYSTCCGAETNFTEIGICPECLEHCDWEYIEDDESFIVVNKEEYKTTILTVDHGPKTYTIIHSEMFDDIFTHEWFIDDESNDEITEALYPTLYNELIDIAKQHIMINLAK